MKPFKLFFEHYNNTTAVIAYGRYNPPTVGHEKLIEKVGEVARREHAVGFIIPSHSVNNKKDPLNIDEKIAVISTMADGIHILRTGKTLISAIQDLQKRGFTKIIHIAGSDRIPEFENLIAQYNCEPDKSGTTPFCFESYTFESAGERDPDSDGVEGMSASKLRQYALSGELELFKQGMSPKVDDAMKEEIYNKIRERIK